jgi:hypothetical protein
MSRGIRLWGIGLAAVHIAAALGANVIAIDINDTKPRGMGGEGSLPVGNPYQQQ